MYVPILKYKQAEEMALRAFSDSEKKQVTPLLQLVHRIKPIKNTDGTTSYQEIPHDVILTSSISKITKHLYNFPAIYFDPQPLFASINDDILSEIMKSDTGLFGTNIVPVLTYNDIVQNKFNSESKDFFNKQGICLRICKEEITEKFWQNIDSFLERLSLKRGDVHIIFDYKIAEKNITTHFSEQLGKGQKLSGWKSVTIASGAFPKDFVGKVPATYKYERLDLQLWKELTVLEGFRTINFGDYSIQHPIYTFINKRVSPSRSIRYALEGEWIVMKGQSDNAEGSAKLKQYFAHAVTLVKKGYLLKDCCSTDAEIIMLSNDPNRETGSFQKWIKLGIIHHTLLTIRQISNPSV